MKHINQNAAKLLGIILLALAAYFFGDQRGNSNNHRPRLETPNSHSIGADASDRDIMSSLQANALQYTKHARCRMGCRHISEKEVKEILKKGKINHRKSKPADYPCGSYAVEGMTSDNQEVRIVFAACETKTKVITTIDLRNDYKCNCK